MPRRFRSKALAGKVPVRGAGMPGGEVCLLRTGFCLPWTTAVRTMDCVGGQFDASSYRRRLAELKSDLRDALTEVQVHQRFIADPVAQARRLALDELEAGLKEILQQVTGEKEKGTKKNERRPRGN